MRLILSALAFCLFMPLAAQADGEMIYREDSGLIKTEYLLASGKYSAALDTANDILARRPNSADAYTYKGYALLHLGQKTEAAKNFKQALAINPTHLGANKYLADIYLDEGNVARAIEQLQVIRMACGESDCAEVRSLQLAIDQNKAGIKPKDGKKEDQSGEE